MRQPGTAAGRATAIAVGRHDTLAAMRCPAAATGCRAVRQKVVAGAAVMLIVVLGGCGDPASRPAPAGGQDRDGFAVLVFTRTTGFRHASIEDGVAAIRRLAAGHGFAVDATEDPGQVQDAVLTGK